MKRAKRGMCVKTFAYVSLCLSREVEPSFGNDEAFKGALRTLICRSVATFSEHLSSHSEQTD